MPNYKENYEDVLFKIGGDAKIGDVLQRLKKFTLTPVQCSDLIYMWGDCRKSLGELMDESGFKKNGRLKNNNVEDLLKYVNRFFDNCWTGSWGKYEDND